MKFDPLQILEHSFATEENSLKSNCQFENKNRRRRSLYQQRETFFVYRVVLRVFC